MQRLFDAFEAAGYELYLVGGAVRDLLLGHKIETIDDLDFCTNARPETSLEIVVEAGFQTYDEGGTAFGTIGVLLDDPARPERPLLEVQITTYRTQERYDPGSRKPTVEFGETILEDLGRRDLSINSIAMDSRGRYIDPYHGQEDLERGLLRVITNPRLELSEGIEKRLCEDPLRILRVARFVSKLGFSPTNALTQACRRTASTLEEISRERWFVEMNKLLLGDDVQGGLAFLHETGALRVLFPELESCDAEAREQTWMLLGRAAPLQAVRWACLAYKLDAEETEALGRRFRFNNVLRDELRALPGDRDRVLTFDGTDASARRVVHALKGDAGLAMAFARACDTEAVPRMDHLEERLTALASQGALRPSLPAGIGREIAQAWGLKPGPVIGRLRDVLIEGILDGRLENGKEASYYLAAVGEEDVKRAQ